VSVYLAGVLLFLYSEAAALDKTSGYIRNIISEGHLPSTVLSRNLEGTILVIRSSQNDNDSLVQMLRSAGHEVQLSFLDSATPALQQGEFDLIIADAAQVDEVLSLLSHQETAKLIALTDSRSTTKTVELMKLGVIDCIPRPLNRDYVLLVVKRVLEYMHLLHRAEEGERYKQMSKLDGLTELYNHRHFHELLSSELERAMRDNAPLTILMIDVDHFKSYNDKNGHLAGDAALRGIAKILKNSVRGYDIVARYGGEEFALILPGTDEERGMIVAKRLLHCVRTTEFPNEDTLPYGKLTVSVGVASYPTFARDKDALMEGADSAMYAAKANGKDSACAASKKGLLQAG
jgi:diguanylate cyclase (GGDEF)-like protein